MKQHLIRDDVVAKSPATKLEAILPFSAFDPRKFPDRMASVAIMWVGRKDAEHGPVTPV